MNNLTIIKGILILFLGFFTTGLIHDGSTTASSSKKSVNTEAFGKMPLVSEGQINASADNEELIKKITKMYDRYINYRSKTSEIYKSQGWDSDQMIDNEELIRDNDALNLREAKALYDDYGLPTISEVGEEASHRFWMIVLQCNADTEFQTKVLKSMHLAMEKNDISTSDYAYLTDRIRVNQNRPQVYGTQIWYNDLNKTYEPYQLKKPETVDQRRIIMGLEGMKKYINKMNLKYDGSLKRKKPAKRLNRRI